MRQRFLAGLLLCLLAVSGRAQGWKPYRQLNAAEIFHEVQKLGVTGSVLYIAAHPDDENTKMLAWLANEKKVRTGYLSLTRGDGGQNLIGTEQGEALGILRTQELLAARRIDGAEQFFTRAYDFGFSKNPEETFRFWNHDSVLSDVVWVIRKFQPDVIITRFPTTGEGGHGHHTASAILAGEAFDAAADPTRFPEQLQYVQPWKTKRLFWNTFNFGTTNTTSEDQIKVDVGGYNALLGKSYGEIASEARTMHKSQGFGTALQRGSSVEYFKQIKGDPAKNDLFEGIDLTWNRYPELKDADKAFRKVVSNWDFSAPETNLLRLQDWISNDVAAAYKHYNYEMNYDDAKAGVRFLNRVGAKYAALAPQLAGIWAEGRVEEPMLAQRGRTKVYASMLNRSQVPVDVQRPAAGDTNGVYHHSYQKDTSVAARGRSSKPFALAANQSFLDTSIYYQRSSPDRAATIYWLQNPRQQALFSRPALDLLGMPEAPSPSISRSITTNGSSFTVELPLVTKTIDPVKGEIYQPLQILPEVTLDILANSLVFENYQPKTVFVKIHCHADSISGNLEIDAPDGWAMQSGDRQVRLRKGQDTTLAVKLIPSKTATNYYFTPVFVSGEKRFSQHARFIHYDHIPNQTYLSETKAYVTAFPLQKGGTRIGYITGAGDEVPEALRNVGYTVTELNENQIQSGDLSRFDAIVTGVRAYNTQDWLQGAYPRLMDYVRKGGNLIVQYNTNSRIGPVKAQIGPDSFTITRDRVTDENAAVTFLAPQHPVLNTPNKITQSDFNGWLQERSIYHASNWASSFTPVLSMADAGEKPATGSLIVAPYGKGNFVYTGLVFFRELPAGIPGAYRLFANLLAIPKR
ncbi:MAG: PIG-L family deacetylase [Sphingobacteriales bacterium]|nr:MAG: PIG-L family deacetylase [Sphingobacteriales bacterium]